MLIETNDYIFNIDHIATIVPFGNDKKVPMVRVTMRDGETLHLRTTMQVMRRYCGTVIPVRDGYRVIQAWDDDGEAIFFDDLPVIAFRYSGEAEAVLMPITAHGEPVNDDFGVLMPDGTCRDQECIHEIVDAFKVAFTAKVEARRLSARRNHRR